MIFCLAGNGSAFRGGLIVSRLLRFLASGIDRWQEVRGAVVDDLVVNLERGIALLLDSLEKSE